MPRHQRQHPQLIDPAGVQPGIGPRPMGMTGDESRAHAVSGTGGEPIVDFEGRRGCTGLAQHVTSHRFFPELWSIRTQL